MSGKDDDDVLARRLDRLGELADLRAQLAAVTEEREKWAQSYADMLANADAAITRAEAAKKDGNEILEELNRERDFITKMLPRLEAAENDRDEWIEVHNERVRDLEAAHRRAEEWREMAEMAESRPCHDIHHEEVLSSYNRCIEAVGLLPGESLHVAVNRVVAERQAAEKRAKEAWSWAERWRDKAEATMTKLEAYDAARKGDGPT